MKKTILTFSIIAATGILLSSCGGNVTEGSSSNNDPSSNEESSSTNDPFSIDESSSTNDPSSNEESSSTNDPFSIDESSSTNDPSSNEVTIGSQVWMTKNLDVSTFRNGDPIPQAKTNEEWQKAGENRQPAWCYYDNDPANGAKYGKLYNWYAVNDPRGLAPVGYHIPSEEEWTELIDFLGWVDLAEKMKSTSGWYQNGNGTNSSGFSALPGGYRHNGGTFVLIGSYGYWWSSSHYWRNRACYRSLDYTSIPVVRERGVKRDVTNIEEGLSVRCLVTKDSSSTNDPVSIEEIFPDSEEIFSE